MERIKYIAIICSLLFGFTNCQEEKLSPSYLDIDRMDTLLDWSNPIVKKYYEDYGVALLTEFDKNLDLCFDFLSQEQGALISFWKNLDIGKMTRKTECDSAITVLDTAVFKYFKDEIEIEEKIYHPKFKEKYFPNKILITNKLESAENVFGLIMQTVNRPSSTGVGASYFQSNDNAVVVNLESEMLHTDSEKFDRVTKSILFCMIAYAFDKYDLYKQVPMAFYEYSKPYYEQQIEDIQILQGEEPYAISRQEYVERFNMVCTTIAPTENLNGFLSALTLPSAQEDVKVFIDHLINSETLEGSRQETTDPYGNTSWYVWKWTPQVTVKMWYIARTLMKLGIDVLAINQDPVFHDVVNRTQEDIENIQL
jgi:hypothetical protein